jgi:hypothetical protein
VATLLVDKQSSSTKEELDKAVLSNMGKVLRFVVDFTPLSKVDDDGYYSYQRSRDNGGRRLSDED